MSEKNYLRSGIEDYLKELKYSGNYYPNTSGFMVSEGLKRLVESYDLQWLVDFIKLMQS